MTCGANITQYTAKDFVEEFPNYDMLQLKAVGSLIALLMSMVAGQNTLSTNLDTKSYTQTQGTPEFESPCPTVFTYEPPGTEAGKWYGVVNLTTDTTLYSLWLNIVLDGKADILGNWVGEVTTEDNTDFKIENTKLKITPGPPLVVRFFIQYNAQNTPPKLKAIRFNGKEICEVETPLVAVSETPDSSAIKYEDVISDVTNFTYVKPIIEATSISYDRHQTKSTTQNWQSTKKPQTTTTYSYWPQQRTEKPNNSYRVKSENKQTPTSKPQNRTEAKITVHTVPTVSTTQYWQQTTSTPVYWTQSTKSESKSQTVRPQSWPYVHIDTNKQTVTTVRPTTSVWSQTRTVSKLTTTTEKTSQWKTQSWPYVKVDDNQQTKTDDQSIKPIDNYQNSLKTKTVNTSVQYTVEKKQELESGNRYEIQNAIQRRKTENPPIWPNANETDDQKDSFKRTESQSEVKSVLQFWSKLPTDNTTGVAANVPTKIETSYAWSDKPPKRNDDRLVQIDSTAEHPSDYPVYVRPEDVKTISGNRNKVKKNQAISQSFIESENRPPVRTSDSYSKTSEQRVRNRDEIEARPLKGSEDNSGAIQNWSGERTSSRSSADEPKNTMEYNSAGASLSYTGNDGSIKYLDESSLPFHKYQLTTEVPPPPIFKTENTDEYDIPKKDDKVEYYVGGLPIFYIPNHGPQSRSEECGKVLLNKEKPHERNVHTYTLEGQWPWQIAVYQQQTTVDFRYICGGTLVSKRHVITAAHCVTKKASTRVVNKNTLTIYLGKHNLRNSVEGVQVKFVSRILVHPDFGASNFKSDLAILELRDSVKFSDWVQPACLWPENEADLKYVVGQRGSVVGWGYEATGVAKEELSLLEMPVVDQQTCLNSYKEFFSRFTSDTTYCAGYRDRNSACNGDSGGGMFFEKEDSWYLRGVVSLSVAKQGDKYRCDPNHYVIFTDVAKFLPWIEDNIEDYY